MALDSVFLAKFQNDDRFKENAAAWAIVNDGLSGNFLKPSRRTLICNVCFRICAPRAQPIGNTNRVVCEHGEYPEGNVRGHRLPKP